MTRATTGKWKYWVGHLILDKGGQGYPDPGTIGPRIDRPACKPGATMPVSDRSHWGMITTDIKQVEWYAAQKRAWGVAVYFENLHADDDDEKPASTAPAGAPRTIENRVGRTLCPIRLLRQFRTWFHHCLR